MPDTSTPRSLWQYGSSDPLPRPISLPFAGSPGYLAFSPDIGAFNNILVNFEVMALLAWLSGRTLVIPPPSRFHLLGDEPFSLLDFIDRRILEKSIGVVTAEELEERQGLGFDPAEGASFQEALRKIAFVPEWGSDQNAVVVPHDAITRRVELIPRLLRRRAVSLQGELAGCDLLYFASSERSRILGPFETFILFADIELEQRARRFVRDAIRYHPRILDLAGQLLRAANLLDAPYSTMHIRRGDFEYLETRVDAEAIVSYTSSVLERGETVYIATDEQDEGFLTPFRGRYRVVTWRDLPKSVTAAVPVSWVGIIETLICAAATSRFVGTRLSTFSARAATVRGHLSATPGGARFGVDATLYYTQPRLQGAASPDARVGAAAETAEPWWESVLHTPLWGRAYPVVWTDAS